MPRHLQVGNELRQWTKEWGYLSQDEIDIAADAGFNAIPRKVEDSLPDDEYWPDDPPAIWEEDVQHATAQMDLDDLLWNQDDYRMKGECPACGWSDDVIDSNGQRGFNTLNWRHQNDQPGCEGELEIYAGPFNVRMN